MLVVSIIEMSLAYRIIPRLDIKGPNLVKGVHLEGLRVLGKPEYFAKYYYEQGADELFYQDVVASLYGRNSLHEIISKTAKAIFIPLTVGGGIRTIDDIKNALRSGADKVSINTSAIENPDLIKKASNVFGKSTIVVAIEAIKQPDGHYLAFTDNGRNYTGIEVTKWAKNAEELGAGEIVLTSVDREGTGSGFDSELIKRVTEVVSIPVVVHGGAGRLEHLAQIFNNITEISGVSIASILHYDYIKKYKNLDGYESEGNIDFLKSSKSMSHIHSTNLINIKEHLISKNINCRVVHDN